MNDIQILKEIAFYSKLIDQQKKRLKYRTEKKYVERNTFNKFKYIKKDHSVIMPQTSSKVLINPNFKQCVLINPHFNIQNRVIHINPKILNNNISRTQINHSDNSIKPVIVSKTVELNKNTRKRRLSVHTKYKIVKSNQNLLKLSECNKTVIKNRYKIDRRTKTVIKKKRFQSLSDILRHNVFKNRIWRKSSLKNQFKVNNTRITNISGVLYSKTKTKLEKLTSRQKVINKKLVKINKCVRKSCGKLSKTKNSSKRLKPNLSINNLRLKQNKLRKNNQPCPVYRRYGQCRRKEAGRCHFVHNSDQIFLCKKFLQGACIDKNCLLSHKISKEKMPTCKYFLEGCCVRNDCPYLHVKINAKADICRKFLEGYCEKGIECNLRHQFLCPNFEKHGKCPNRKCMYPHKNKIEIEKPKTKLVEMENTEQITSESLSTLTARYYTDNVDTNFKSNEQQVKIHVKKPKLGTLPSFIPFN